jgi:hypothetical protein
MKTSNMPALAATGVALAGFAITVTLGMLVPMIGIRTFIGMACAGSPLRSDRCRARMPGGLPWQRNLRIRPLSGLR